ncbi:MAG: sugar MFS transporter [Gemmataceae bacterium]
MIGIHELTWLVMTGGLTFGLLLAMGTALRPAIAERLQLEESAVEGLFAAWQLAFVPALFLAGLLVDSWGVKPIACLGLLLGAFGIAGLALDKSIPGTLGAIIVTAIAAGCVGVSTAVMMPQAFFANDETASTNLGFVFFGLGALLAPQLTASLIRALGSRRGICLVACWCLVPGFLAAFTSSESYPRPEVAIDTTSLLANPLVWVAALVVALYTLLEGLLGPDARPYFTEVGLAPPRQALVITFGWLAFLASRLLVGFLHHQQLLSSDSDPWVIVLLAAIGAIALGNLAGTHSLGNAIGGAILMGFLLGPILPTIVGYVFKHVSLSGTAFGTVYAVGVATSLVAAPTKKALIAPRSGMIFLTGAAVLLAVGALALAVMG